MPRKTARKRKPARKPVKRKTKRTAKKPRAAKRRPPKLTKHSVKKVASLASTRLKKRELNKLSRELDKILDAFDRLQELDALELKIRQPRRRA